MTGTRFARHGVTGPQPTPPVTLASVEWDWGSAYQLGYRDDQWIAARRDGHGILRAATLTALETAIETDYRHRPVSRDFDPPDATDYLDPPACSPCPATTATPARPPAMTQTWTAAPCSIGRVAARASGLDDHLLHRTARLDRPDPQKTICQHSAASLAITLVLIERRDRQLARGPGCDWPGPAPAA